MTDLIERQCSSTVEQQTIQQERTCKNSYDSFNRKTVFYNGWTAN
jgi:hypothetical protein